jgi:hypothetical protein
MAYSIIIGLFFFAAFIGISSGSSHVEINIDFTAAVLVGWTWLSMMAARMISDLSSK